MENIVQIKLGEVFEVEGKLYVIQIPESSAIETNLSDGRIIIEIVK